ncbi:MAG: phosphate ABC transporter permease PstA [Planctomycetaceae bacterium]
MKSLGTDPQLTKRHRISRVFEWTCRISTWAGMLILVVLLISVAARVNHPGSLSAFVDGTTPDEASLQSVQDVLLAHPSVKAVKRDVDQSGNVSYFMEVGERPLNDEGHPKRYEDIRFELMDSTASVDVPLTLDSSEPIQGWDWGFLTRYPSPLEPERAGILPGIWGSVWLVSITALIAVPLGIGAAVYLEEYAGETWVTRMIKLNLANLAGVPSIVYGILGFAVFVRFFGKRLMAGGIQLMPLGSTVLAGAFTLALLILPVIIVATQEALRAIPQSIRSASIALGATKWQTIRHQILPAGLPGIATGVILALSRAIGETAPIVVIGVLSFTNSTPGGIESPVDLVKKPGSITEVPFDNFTTIPIQIYNWVPKAQPEFAAQAARAILVLLFVLLCVNSIAIYVRNRYQKNLKW